MMALGLIIRVQNRASFRNQTLIGDFTGKCLTFGDHWMGEELVEAGRQEKVGIGWADGDDLGAELETAATALQVSVRY